VALLLPLLAASERCRAGHVATATLVWAHHARAAALAVPAAALPWLHHATALARRERLQAGRRRVCAC